jgi:predicted pyridoxine 5'-phosphate oxidase superfamily flavin-nucleotide-binding protein
MAEILFDDVIRLIIKLNYLVLVGSVNPKGIPNISPRYVLGILGNEKLLFADAFENKTFHNISAWPKVSVAVFDKEMTGGGYQLKGEVEDVTDSQLAVRAKDRLREFGVNLDPKKVWVLNVKEVYSLERSEKSKHPIVSAYS